jgi:hypothetical protein
MDHVNIYNIYNIYNIHIYYFYEKLFFADYSHNIYGFINNNNITFKYLNKKYKNGNLSYCLLVDKH